MLWSLVQLIRRIPGPRPVNLHYNPALPHHTPAGFRNNYPHRPPTEEELNNVRRQMDRARVSAGSAAVPAPVKPDLAFLHANRSQPSVTWIGHSTVLVQMGGINVLTDPMFGPRASPVSFAGPRRLQPPGIALRDLPRIDLVVLSHNHYDHMNRPSLRALARQKGGPPVFAVPLGLDRWIGRNLPLPAESVKALDWWQSAELDGSRVTLVPTHHWSARTPWNRNENLWGAWIVESADGFRFYFSGDLAWSSDVTDVGERLAGFDLAAIAVGHYEPRWFMKNHHVNPDEAVRVHRALHAKRSLAIHHSTFQGLTIEPLDQPLKDLAEARRKYGMKDDEFFALRHGETRRL